MIDNLTLQLKSLSDNQLTHIENLKAALNNGDIELAMKISEQSQAELIEFYTLTSIIKSSAQSQGGKG